MLWSATAPELVTERYSEPGMDIPITELEISDRPDCLTVKSFPVYFL